MAKNKVKSIIRRNNRFKTFVSITTKLLMLGIIGFMAVFCGISLTNSFILKSDADMKELVELTDRYWDDEGELDARIDAIIGECGSVDAVLFVNDDFEVIHNAGTDAPDFSNDELFPYEALRRFRETGILREESTAQTFDVGMMLPELLGTIRLQHFSTSPGMLSVAEENVTWYTQWLVYRTEREGVNVCARYTYNINRYYSGLMTLICVILVLVLVLFIFSGFFFTLSIIRRNVYANRIIYTDPVTGGYNRDYFISNALLKLNRKKQHAVIQFRLEKYRNYCTAYGVKQGEQLLERIYYCARQKLHRKEKVAHLEGADFALLLQYEDREQLEERLKSMIDAFNSTSEGRHLLFSAGICPVKSRKTDASGVLTAAGLALSKTKNQNTHIVWFSDDMKVDQIWERRVEDDMDKALVNHEFQVYLQPKYSTKRETLAAAEALVRWVHPELGFIPPGKFIPIFENNGFILQLDDYMLREIAKLQSRWLKEGKRLVPISVNVSRAHFSMDDLAEHICAIVDEYSVPHKYIELELTESAFFDDKETLLSTVKKLKKYGFKISMDDFGAGYSSLNSLKELPLDIIKLDAEFFRGIDDKERANAIVGDTIALAKKLGMEIVAEGIESREQVDFLAGQDCDLIQGFFFAKPLPVSEFVKRAWGV